MGCTGRVKKTASVKNKTPTQAFKHEMSPLEMRCCFKENIMPFFFFFFKLDTKRNAESSKNHQTLFSSSLA